MVGALGAVPKNLEKHLRTVGINEITAPELQKLLYSELHVPPANYAVP